MPKSVLANTLGAAQCVTCVWTAVCGSSCVLTDEVSQGDTMLAPHGPAHTHLGPWSHGVIQSLVRHHVVRAVRLSRAATQQRRLSDSLCLWTEDAVKNSRRGGGRDPARALTHNRHFFSQCHDVVARPPWSGSTGLATCREGRFVLTEGLLVCQTGWHHGYFMRLFYGV